MTSGVMQMRMKEMSQVGYIFLGWLLGVLSMLIARWLQAKEDKQKKEIDILSETLKYIFSIKQTYNNLLTDKSLLEKSRKEFPGKFTELEKQMYTRFDREIGKDFFPDLMFHSFQLKRLGNKSFWNDFEIIMNKYEALGKMIMEQSDMDKISELNNEIMTLMRTFVEKCNAKAKV